MAGRAVLHSVRVEDLFSQDADKQTAVEQAILKAFTEPESMGVIAVDGISSLLERRAALLPLAAQLAALPEDILSGLEHPASNYLIGWSRGKEMLAGGDPDVNKGSFYANPLVDQRLQPASPDVETDATDTHHDSNVWPEEALPALEPAFKATGELICDTATAIMAHCDRIVCKRKLGCSELNASAHQNAQEVPAAPEKASANANTTPTAPDCIDPPSMAVQSVASSEVTTHPTGSTSAVLEPKVGQKRASPPSESTSICEKASSHTCDSAATMCGPAGESGSAASRTARIHVPVSDQKSNKARLLHYYPPDPAIYHKAGDWCGWHFDIGTITGLTAAMYLPANCTDAASEVGSPDTEAGLHVRSHDGSVVRVAARKDQMLFQVGQSLQVMSGGLFKATEHYVKAPKKPMDVARCTFAVFCQPNSDDVLQPVVETSSCDHGVPHWAPGITFGQFRDRVTAASCPSEA